MIYYPKLFRMLLKKDIRSISDLVLFGFKNTLKSMICLKCLKANAYMKTPCGHNFHTHCFRGELKKCCPKCGTLLKDFHLFWDILRKAGINESVDYYKDISGSSDWLKGLVMWLIDNDTDKVLWLKIYNRHLRLFKTAHRESFKQMVLEESLLKGDLRLARHYIPDKNIAIRPDVLETVWERDQMELLADFFDGETTYYDDNGSTGDRDPLRVAAKTGDFGLLNRLIAKGVNLSRSMGGTCAFQIAYKSSESFASPADQIRFLDLMLTNGVNLDEFNEHQFELFLNNNSIELLAYLISKMETRSKILLDAAIRNSNFEMVKFLHEAGFKFNELIGYKKPSSLYLACYIRSFEIVKYIIDSGGVSMRGEQSSLHVAILYKRLEIVELLLRFGTHPNHADLLTACSLGSLEMVQLLIEYGADPRADNEVGCSLLLKFNFNSINDQKKLFEIIEYFHRIGAATNREKSYSVLDLFCQSDSNLPIITSLVEEFGADVNTVSMSGMTPTYCACFRGCPNIVRFMLRNCGNLNDYSSCERNGYLHAISSGDLETVKITLALCHKNSVDDFNRGPLFYILSSRSGNPASIFEYLSNEGVNMNILDYRGNHPLTNEFSWRQYCHLNIFEKYFGIEENYNFFDISMIAKCTGNSAYFLRMYRERARQNRK